VLDAYCSFLLGAKLIFCWFLSGCCSSLLAAQLFDCLIGSFFCRGSICFAADMAVSIGDFPFLFFGAGLYRKFFGSFGCALLYCSGDGYVMYTFLTCSNTMLSFCGFVR
jgi:hypothetical protein